LELGLWNAGGWFWPDGCTPAAPSGPGAWTWEVRTDMSDFFENAIGHVGTARTAARTAASAGAASAGTATTGASARTAAWSGRAWGRWGFYDAAVPLQ
ncbi:MAG: hypothetical protein ACTMIV_11095, partial [Brevibacterium aurantiacum]